jgi:serine phosphatase RsbU (regulator of sigma subunit)
VQPDGDYQDVNADLQPGDVVEFASDGLPEVPAQASVSAPEGSPLTPPAAARELFGFERLAQSVAHWSAAAESAEAVASGIWTDLTSWCGPDPHHDDMTLLVLRVPS